MKEKDIITSEIVEESEARVVDGPIEAPVVEGPIVEEIEVPKKEKKRHTDPASPPPSPKAEEYSFIDEADGL